MPPRRLLPGFRTPLLAKLLLISLLFPPEMSYQVAGLRLTVYRLLLLATCVFSTSKVLLRSSRHGAASVADWLVVFHVFWAFLATASHSGLGVAFESSGIYAVEACGGYFLARCWLVSPVQIIATLRFLLFTALCSLAGTIPEAATGVHYWRDIGAMSMGGRRSFAHDMDPRSFAGVLLHRAFGPFDHPILYGVFCSVSMSTAWVSAGFGSWWKRALSMFGVVFATFLSVSSGAIAPLIVQAGLLLYNRVTRGIGSRWFVLAASIVTVYVFIDTLSNRSALKVFFSYLTFSESTAYGREAIWTYGLELLFDQGTLLGVQLETAWDPPFYSSGSIDAFWLMTGLQYGLPGALSLVAVALIAARRLGVSVRAGGPLSEPARGLLFSMIGLSVGAVTVHFWNSLFVFFMFMLGVAVSWCPVSPARRLPGSHRFPGAEEGP